jgi:hypothetical protein
MLNVAGDAKLPMFTVVSERRKADWSVKVLLNVPKSKV